MLDSQQLVKFRGKYKEGKEKQNSTIPVRKYTAPQSRDCIVM